MTDEQDKFETFAVVFIVVVVAVVCILFYKYFNANEQRHTEDYQNCVNSFSGYHAIGTKIYNAATGWDELAMYDADNRFAGVLRWSRYGGCDLVKQVNQ